MVQELSKYKKACLSSHKTPGPGYMLPTLIGDKAHDPRSVHRKNPSYSFGIRHGKLKDTLGPGPCHFINAKSLRDGCDAKPQYSMYGQLKVIRNKTFVPSTAVDISKMSDATKYQFQPAYSFGNNFYNKPLSNTPGSNCYNAVDINVKSFKERAPSYSMLGFLKLGKYTELAKKTPGPAMYPWTDPNVYKMRGPSYCLNDRNYMPGNRTQNPGPATHMAIKTPVQQSIPAYSFGVKHFENMTLCKEDTAKYEFDACS